MKLEIPLVACYATRPFPAKIHEPPHQKITPRADAEGKTAYLYNRAEEKPGREGVEDGDW
jgi:hypothetical protein